MEGYEMYGKIQARKKIGYSQRLTAKELEIDRGTVKKYWNMKEDEYAEYRIEIDWRELHVNYHSRSLHVKTEQSS